MALPFALFRSGTSRGPYVRLDRLLGSPAARDAAVAALIGSGTPNQVGGLGGNTAVTCKACLVGPPEAASPSRKRPRSPPDHDVRYLFRQVRVAEPSVDSSHGDCGNMIAAVGAFALEEGLVAGPASSRVLSGAEAEEAVAAAEVMEPASRAVVVLSESTGVRFEIVVPLLKLPHGLEAVDYRGLRHPKVCVDGLPGTAAGVAVKSQRPQGGTLGRLLPTGRAIDDLGEVRVSCVDCSRPLVIVDRAEIQALAPVSDWSPAGIAANRGLLEALERVRLAAAERMGMGDVRGKVSPKICVVGRGFDAEERRTRA
jgi:2-methylaconitate cis-trans-isomerase PrpF